MRQYCSKIFCRHWSNSRNNWDEPKVDQEIKSDLANACEKEKFSLAFFHWVCLQDSRTICRLVRSVHLLHLMIKYKTIIQIGLELRTVADYEHSIPDFYHCALIHSSRVVQQKLTELHFELVPYPVHSYDVAPSDFYLFEKLKTCLDGQKFGCN